MDFGGFGEPSREGKSMQDRSKIDPKGHQKNSKKRGVLEAPWRRLGAPKSIGVDRSGRSGRSGRGGGDAGATPRKDS